MIMNASVITALAALAAQTREQRLAHYQFRRQELYKDFMEQAAPLYMDALQSEKPDVSGLMHFMPR